VDAPDLLPFAGRGALPVPADIAGALADVLDVRLASASLDARVRSTGTPHEVPAAVRALLPEAPRTWFEHDAVVAGDRELDWRVEEGVVHAATLDGLARGLAWAAGAWPRRADVAALLAEPDADDLTVETLLAEADLG
jgi:hypothetical protein